MVLTGLDSLAHGVYEAAHFFDIISRYCVIVASSVANMVINLTFS